jgi:hypothetical protein
MIKFNIAEIHASVQIIKNRIDLVFEPTADLPASTKSLMNTNLSFLYCLNCLTDNRPVSQNEP